MYIRILSLLFFSWLLSSQVMAGNIMIYFDQDTVFTETQKEMVSERFGERVFEQIKHIVSEGGIVTLTFDSGIGNDFRDAPEPRDPPRENKNCRVNVTRHREGRGDVKVDGKVVGGGANGKYSETNHYDVEVPCDQVEKILDKIIDKG